VNSLEHFSRNGTASSPHMSLDAEAACSGRDKLLGAYDSKLKREILFRIFPHCLPSDNPQQAENSSGVGPGGNRNCIRGKGGGNREEKESNEGYHALFSVSPIVSPTSAWHQLKLYVISRIKRSERHRRLLVPSLNNFGWHAGVWRNP